MKSVSNGLETNRPGKGGINISSNLGRILAFPVVICLMIAHSSTEESLLGCPTGIFSLSGYASLAKTATLDLDTPV